MNQFNQYMNKEAGSAYEAMKDILGWIPKTLQVGTEAAHTLLPLTVIAPAIAGSTAGFIHSKMTSPSEDESDVTTAQDESLARMYEMEATKRRRELIEKIKQQTLNK